jgi:hypothetical protein
VESGMATGGRRQRNAALIILEGRCLRHWLQRSGRQLFLCPAPNRDKSPANAVRHSSAELCRREYSGAQSVFIFRDLSRSDH